MGAPTSIGPTRRSVVLNAAAAGLAAALSLPARASIDRGLVGNIKPIT
jgi:hypothetical protein